ncbi:MAG: DUF342 domain-containing protein [Candidatus Eisenbacteria sp.]|nr:DUF342 domain-containing protein [Candidatus Eisenbacteria bacterium]
MDTPPGEPTTDRDSDQSRRGDFNLRVSPDRMAVLLDCDTSSVDLGELEEAIRERMLSMGIAEPPDGARLLRLLTAAAKKDPRIKELELAEGLKPVQPLDGRIEWAGDFFNPGFVVDEETGKIDYKQRVAMTSVMEGDLLARAIPPTEGREGLDVLGRPVRTAKPRRPRIRVGKNVRHDKEESAYYAAERGRVRWVDGVLSVDNVYQIRGNVGPTTGHILHPGAVVVTGDVQEGYNIESLGDIEVRGFVEAAQLQTSGSLMVRGGMIGAEGQRIVVSGDIHAKFIMDADVLAGGDVYVEREIIRSHVISRGSISIPNGRVVGGEIRALRGVVAGQVGSVANVSTTVVAGEDYSLEETALTDRMEIELLEQRLAREFGQPGPDVEEMETTRQDLQDEVEEIRGESCAPPENRVKVRNKIFPGAAFRLEGTTLTARDKYRRPFELICRDDEVLFVEGTQQNPPPDWLFRVEVEPKEGETGEETEGEEEEKGTSDGDVAPPEDP